MRIAVHHLALACCAVEVSAAIALDLPAQIADLEIGEFQEADLQVLIVAGTISTANQSAVLDAWQALPEPKAAIAYGVCASSGGPYWDSYATLAGLSELIPTTRFVPGCPPPRQTLLEAVAAVAMVHQ
jgi:NADH-quinone oxidoreductase subunit B